MARVARFLSWLRRRDPGEQQHRQQFINLELMKSWKSGYIMMFGIIGTIAYDQINDPSRVKLPIQDGRSGVT